MVFLPTVKAPWEEYAWEILDSFFVLVPGIPALSMSDIDFDFGGVWPKEIIKSNRDCAYMY